MYIEKATSRRHPVIPNMKNSQSGVNVSVKTRNRNAVNKARGKKTPLFHL